MPPCATASKAAGPSATTRPIGPLHAGSFPPGRLDATFGPQVRFVKGPSTPNQPPSAGLQFAGEVEIDGATEQMTVRIFDLAGEVLFEVALSP